MQVGVYKNDFCALCLVQTYYCFQLLFTIVPILISSSTNLHTNDAMKPARVFLSKVTVVDLGGSRDLGSPDPKNEAQALNLYKIETLEWHFKALYNNFLQNFSLALFDMNS